jgi:hypothetical protein
VAPVRRAAPLLVATAVALGLAGVYAALGGGSYKPVAVADPCAERARSGSGGVSGGIERVVLSALDGAACTLGVSREELVLALRSTSALHNFARKEGISEDEVDDAVRTGIVRAVDDAENDGSIEPRTAGVLRTAAERLPIGFVLDLIRDAARFLPG